jgi:hypothetical protein
MADKPKVTKLRLQIPKGMKIEDVVNRLEISFEPAAGGAAAPHFNENYCCVDVAVAGPFSSISAAPGGDDDTGTA